MHVQKVDFLNKYLIPERLNYGLESRVEVIEIVTGFSGFEPGSRFATRRVDLSVR